MLVLVLVFAGTTHADGPSPSKRIVGGQPASIAAWPWQVALVQPGGGSAANRQFCGGSLVAPTIVITAAHCVFDDGSGTFVAPSSVNVVTGRTNLSSSSGQEIPVAQIHVLRGSGGQRLYNPQNTTFDVEVLELAAPSSAGTIKLAGADEGALWTGGRSAYVTGWGSTFPGGGGYPDGLRVAAVNMASDAQCADTLQNLFVQSVMVCAGAPPSRDTCDGDSGGPLVVPMLGGGYRLVGDTSFGLSEPCGQSVSAYGRLGADPLRSLIRTKVMQVAGVDVVGSAGKPPTGGGGGSLTATQARERAWAYSKQACIADRRCRQYHAAPCVAQGTGFNCEVRNYEKFRRRPRKATCSRNLAVSLSGTTITATPLNNWNCRRGWHRSAGRSL